MFWCCKKKKKTQSSINAPFYQTCILFCQKIVFCFIFTIPELSSSNRSPFPSNFLLFIIPAYGFEGCFQLNSNLLWDNIICSKSFLAHDRMLRQVKVVTSQKVSTKDCTKPLSTFQPNMKSWLFVCCFEDGIKYKIPFEL